MLVTLLTATAMMMTTATSAAAFSSPHRPPGTTRKNNNLTALRLQQHHGDRGVERRIAHGNRRSRRRRRSDSANNSASSSKLSAAAAARSSMATSTSAIIENSATTTTAMSNLAVALDRPLLSPVEFGYRNPSTGRTAAAWWISSFMSVLVSDIFKTACVAFIVAAGVLLLPRLMATRDTTTTNDGENVMSIRDSEGGMSYAPAASSSSSLQSTIRQLTNKATKIINGLQQMATTTTTSYTKKKKNRKSSSSSSSSSYSVPMPFNGDGNWNKCTLSSRIIPVSSGVGRSTYSIYEFALPETYYTLSLGLGQQLEFCCLGPDDEICTGSFYLYDGSSGCATAASASASTTSLSLDGDDDERKKNIKTKSNKRGGGGDTTTTTTGVVRIVISNDKLADEGNSMFVSFFQLYIYLLVKPPSISFLWGKAFSFCSRTLSYILFLLFFPLSYRH